MSEISMSNQHLGCDSRCARCNLQEDRSPEFLRQKFGKPIYELADRQEDSE